MAPYLWPGEAAIVIGTGPSLAQQIREIRQLRAARRARLFGMNCTYRDFPTLDVHTACNIEWWQHYGDDFVAWRGGRECASYHWDEHTCKRYGLHWMPGRWGRGLSADPSYIHYGHSSGVQALNLAVHYGCDPILLVGFEMTETKGQPRHYFTGLSDIEGEYPPPLRHHAKLSNGHEGLLPIYREIAEQHGLPRIVNCTIGGKLDYFPRAFLQDEC